MTEKTSRDKNVDRIGRVTVYRHGASYWLYYRENRKTVRTRIEGNLATARATASKVNAALEEKRPSPLGFVRMSVPALLDKYLESCRLVRNLSPSTLSRYRAALFHFREFCAGRDGLDTAEMVSARTVEEFVKFMRSKTRVRSGATKGKHYPYRMSGIRFILSTCRSAFNYACKQRFLPPYSDNPFASFPIEKMKDRAAPETPLLTPQQLVDFFAACDEWQFGIFLTLALYGLRVGELTHLAISDVDLEENLFRIQSKPLMFWHAKTRHERILPILPEVRPLFLHRIASRKEGFLFLNRAFFEGRREPPKAFSTAGGFRSHLGRLAEEAKATGVEGEEGLRRELLVFLREMGQIPQKRIRQELMKVTKGIGCGEVTRAHSLRHLFATLTQENGANPITVQGILGHSSLRMTRHYTHTGLGAKSDVLRSFLHGQRGLEGILKRRLRGEDEG